jgi:hypothetical protein
MCALLRLKRDGCLPTHVLFVLRFLSVLLKLEIEVHNRSVQDSGVGIGLYQSLELWDVRSSVPLAYILKVGEQTPGGLTEITTDTEDMVSTHTKLLSSSIHTIFVESSQTQSRKKG